MAEAKSVPLILNGKYFEIIDVDGEKVNAKCVNCINKTISGALCRALNFRTHLKVNVILQARDVCG